MADFVAVLKKTLDGLSDTTPQMREKVYEKARITIASKLATMNPPLPDAVIEKQKQALEEAIVKVEGEYTRKASDPLAELESVFASLKNPDPRIVLREPAKPAPAAQPSPAAKAPEKPAAASEGPAPASPAPAAKPSPEAAKPAPETVKPAPEVVKSAPELAKAVDKAQPAEKAAPVAKPAPAEKEAVAEKAAPPPVAKAPAEPEPAPLPSTEWFRPDDGPDDQPDADNKAAPSYPPEYDQHETIEDDRPERRRGYGRLIAAAVVLALLAGGGYAAWLNQDQVRDLLARAGIPGFATSPDDTAAAPPPAETPPAPDVAEVEPPASEEPASEEPAAPAPEPANAGPQKFTQRLNPDGTETDPGPAGGAPAIGEGTSIAAVTQPSVPEPEAAQPSAPDQAPPAPDAAATPAPDQPGAAATPPAQPGAPAETPQAAAPATPAQPSEPSQSAEQTVPVGQRAIFYEERTNVADASAEPGSIVWSLVQESPGGDLPPEPAIRAEATIPGKDVQLRMTIRRNADQTLPASHIVEMIFLTPQGFEGGGIDNVLRLSLKGSEQEAGSPLLGIPAKIADGFFLIALNDSKQEIEANTNLLRTRAWIDVPVQYKSGRRALFTMEKGIPGAKVFDEALKAWQAASSG